MNFKETVDQWARIAALNAAPQQCEHPRTELRARTIRGGSVQHVHQCLDCGEPVGNPQRQTGTAPAFDEVMRSTWEQRRTQMREQTKAQESERWWIFYRQYMSSPEWFALRDKVLARDNHLCRGCLESRATEVHHASYRHIGQEFAFELVSLCRPCHERWHAGDEE